MAICRYCQAWDLEPGARFCGECGSYIVPLSARISSGGVDAAKAGVSLASASPDVDLDGLSLVMFDEISRKRVDKAVLDKCTFAPSPSHGATPAFLSRLPELAGLKASLLGKEPKVLVVGIADKDSPDDLPKQKLPGLLAVNAGEARLEADRNAIHWQPSDGEIRLGLSLARGEFAVVQEGSLIVRQRADEVALRSAVAPFSRAIAAKLEPFLLRPGDPPVMLEFPTADLATELQAQQGLLEAFLTIKLAGGIGQTSVPLQPLDFVRAGPAVPRLLVPDSLVEALAGRRARIGFVLRNDGGMPFEYTGLTWSLIDKDGEVVLSGTEMQSRHLLHPSVPLQPGQSLDGEIWPLLKHENGDAIAPRDYRLDIALDGEALKDLRGSVRLRVHAGDRQFDGVVCIDFGTTETAIAWKKPETNADSNIVALDRVQIDTANETVAGSMLIPTVASATYTPGKELDWKFGREALLDHSPVGAAGRTHLFHSLKWNLTKAEAIRLPDDTEVQWIDIAARYLEHVLDLAETHPEICGLIRSAFVTKPAVFTEAQTNRLIKAYDHLRDGFAQSLPSGRGGRLLISESWSPLYAALPMGSGLATSTFRSLLDGWRLPEAITGDALVMTFDVGGGSCDISAFRVTDGDRMEVDEVFKATSQTFCGERFGALIDKEVRAMLYRKLSTGGSPSTLAALGYPVQAPDSPAAGPAAFANDKELKRVRMRFQHNLGIMQGLIPMMAGLIGSSIPVLDRAEMKQHLGVVGTAASHDAAMQIRLCNSSNVSISVVLTTGELTELIERIFVEFRDRYLVEVKEIFERLNAVIESKMPGMTAERSLSLITGRGAHFPLAKGLLLALAEFKDVFRQPPRAAHCLGDEAKWITAQGGVMVGDEINGGEAIDFAADVEWRLCAILSRRTRSRRGPEEIVAEAEFTTSPNPLFKDVSVLAMDKLRERLSTPSGFVEIVQRFEDGRRESLGRVLRVRMPLVDFDKDWLCIALGELGKMRVLVVRAIGAEDAFARYESEGVIV